MVNPTILLLSTFFCLQFNLKTFLSLTLNLHIYAHEKSVCVCFKKGLCVALEKEKTGAVI